MYTYWAITQIYYKDIGDTSKPGHTAYEQHGLKFNLIQHYIMSALGLFKFHTVYEIRKLFPLDAVHTL